MKITREICSRNFEAWSGAVSTLDRIKEEGKCDEFDALIEDLYPDGLTETALNDILWFEDEWVFDSLGIKEEEEEEEFDCSDKWDEIDFDERVEYVRRFLDDECEDKEDVDEFIPSLSDDDTFGGTEYLISEAFTTCSSFSVWFEENYEEN